MIKIKFKNKDGLHREKSIAYINSDSFMTSAWFKNGHLHREDGPAIIDRHGNYKSYYLHGKQLTEKEYYKKLTNFSI